MLYLAYGSNMSSAQMKERCPSAKLVGTGYLKDWKLVFDGHSYGHKGMVADTRKTKGAKTPFVLWKITADEDLMNLDKCEGYIGYHSKRNHYRRKMLPIIFEDKDTKVAIYVMTKCKIWSRKTNSVVSKEYENIIRRGLTEHGLETTYLETAIEESKYI